MHEVSVWLTQRAVIKPGQRFGKVTLDSSRMFSFIIRSSSIGRLTPFHEELSEFVCIPPNKCAEHAPCQGLEAKRSEGYTDLLVSLAYKAILKRPTRWMSKPTGAFPAFAVSDRDSCPVGTFTCSEEFIDAPQVA